MSYLEKAHKTGNTDIILEGLQEYDNKMCFMYPRNDLPLILAVMERRLKGLKKLATAKQIKFAEYLLETVNPDETIIRVPDLRKGDKE